MLLQSLAKRFALALCRAPHGHCDEIKDIEWYVHYATCSDETGTAPL